jgi:hypothetical protein
MKTRLIIIFCLIATTIFAENTKTFNIQNINKIITRGYANVELIKSNEEKIIVEYDKIEELNRFQYAINENTLRVEEIKNGKEGEIKNNFKVEKLHFETNHNGINSNLSDLLFRDQPKIKIYYKSLIALHLEEITDVRTKDYIEAQNFDLKTEGYNDSELKIKATNVKLRFEGMGDNEIEIIATNIECVQEGMSDVELSGKAKYANFKIEGMADLEAEDLIVEKIKIDAQGMVDAEVHATKELDANAEGMADIVYEGNPEFSNKNEEGMGDISKAWF